MSSFSFESRYLEHVIKNIYRYGWLAAAIANFSRYYSGLFGSQYFLLYQTVAVLAIACTFVPFRYRWSAKSPSYTLLVPTLLAFLTIAMQYYFAYPGMHTYNIALSIFLMMSGLWFMPREYYYGMSAILVVLHIVGISSLDIAVPVHYWVLLLACSVPLMMFLIMIQHLIAKYQAAIRSLRDMSKAKDTFLSSVSHEIRNPLNGIMGALEMLTPYDDNQKQKLDAAVFSSKQLSNIVEDILESEKIIRDKVELHTEWHGLMNWQRDINHIANSCNIKPNIKLQLDIELPPTKAALFDKKRLNQVIFNVLNNANKYTHKGNIVLSVSFVDEHLLISVRDTGIGMSESTQARIFERYARADNANMINAQGVGLGLFICKEFVALMGGTISLSSTIDVGSEFTIRIPVNTQVVRASNDSTESSKARRVDDFMPIDILLVEDNEINQVIVSEMLKTCVNSITKANDGQEGLQLTQERRFDIILCDITMPVLDGYQFIEQLRLQGVNTPVIAVSGNVTKGDLGKQEDAGFVASIAKPFTRNDLLTTISSHVNGQINNDGTATLLAAAK